MNLFILKNRGGEMETGRNILTDEKWSAIIRNDASYDGAFYYAVKTTGIFCKPSCKSRVPNKENVLVFDTADAALDKHFRPCKRCLSRTVFFFLMKNGLLKSLSTLTAIITNL